jgi:hypothetical protein
MPAATVRMTLRRHSTGNQRRPEDNGEAGARRLQAAGDVRQPPFDFRRTVHTGADLGDKLEDESGSSNMRPGNGWRIVRDCV